MSGRSQISQVTDAMVEPLVCKVGYNDITPAGREILSGTYKPGDGLYEQAKSLLTHMSMVGGGFYTPKQPSWLITKGYKQGYAKAK